MVQIVFVVNSKNLYFQLCKAIHLSLVVVIFSLVVSARYWPVLQKCSTATTGTTATGTTAHSPRLQFNKISSMICFLFYWSYFLVFNFLLIWWQDSAEHFFGGIDLLGCSNLPLGLASRRSIKWCCSGDKRLSQFHIRDRR